MPTPEYAAFVDALNAAFPIRFSNPGVSAGDYPTGYATALIQGTVAMIASTESAYDVANPLVERAIDEMLHLIREPKESALEMRVLSDVTTNRPRSLGGLRVLPLDEFPLRSAARQANRLIPGAGFLIDTLSPWPDVDRLALLVTQRSSAGEHDMPNLTKYSAASLTARRESEALITALRVGTNATTRTSANVVGQPGYIRIHAPQLRPADETSWWMIRRVVVLTPRLLKALHALSDQLNAWTEPERDRNTALGIAIHRLNRSYEEQSFLEQMVDLAIGLEAALLGGREDDELSFKLRTRAAYLLNDPTDPISSVYGDVKLLYGLRSSVAHGSSIATSQLIKELGKVSVAHLSESAGVRGQLCADRMRDILRRAILARGFLAQAGLWPVKGDVDVDGALIDVAVREQWQRVWRKGVEDLGIRNAGYKAPEPTVVW